MLKEDAALLYRLMYYAGLDIEFSESAAEDAED